MSEQLLTKRRYRDGDNSHLPWDEEIFVADTSHKCPTYVHRSPPCQGSCPAGEDIRGWLNIVRGIEKPPEGTPWQEYAFKRVTEANPFPAIMGRVCPAPCEDGCNRNEVEDHVGINSVEQFIGDYALEHNLKLLDPGKDTGKKVAIIGSGVSGLAVAYQLRLLGHGCTVFEAHDKLGGMARYGIPDYRIPREVLDGEIQRVIDTGVEVRNNTRVGADVSIEELRNNYDAIYLAVGAQSGSALPIPGGDAPNVVSGISFLEAYNQGRMTHSGKKILVIGGGDTAMDVAAVARRIGHIHKEREHDHPESVILGHTEHDVASAANRQGADVTIVYRRPISKMPATKMEINHVTHEGVEIRHSLAPVEVIIGDDGRAKALKVIEADWSSGKFVALEGSEQEIECDMIVPAIGQKGDLKGMEEFDNGWGQIDADPFYRIKGFNDIFVGGDAIKPHLLTTAIGHASIATEGIHHFLNGKEPTKRPRVDVHHFNLLSKLNETHLQPEQYAHKQIRGTDKADFAVHNYEDRSKIEIVPADEIFLGHWEYESRHIRKENEIGADNVLGFFGERIQGLTEEEVIQEANRCMSCGMCFECNNCIIYCPQDAVYKVSKDNSTVGRYVDTDYNKCIGCHICEDVCPSGYIKMGLGE